MHYNYYCWPGKWIVPIAGTLCHKCACDLITDPRGKRAKRIKKGVKTRWGTTWARLNISLHTWYWAKQDWWRLSPGVFEHTGGENRNIYEYESDQLQQSGILTLPHTNTPNSKLRQYAVNLHSIHSSFIGVTAPWRSVKWIAGASYCFSHHSSIYPQMYLLPNRGSWLVNLISGCLCWNMQFS